MMRVLKIHKMPKALAAGLLQDGERMLFLCLKPDLVMSVKPSGAKAASYANRKRDSGDEIKLKIERKEVMELPSVLLFEGDDPVASLAAFFREYAGIDACIGSIVFEGRYNAGSRRRKKWIPALLFAVSAKKKNARAGYPYSGFRWLSFSEIAAANLSRKSEWLCSAGKSVLFRNSATKSENKP